MKKKLIILLAGIIIGTAAPSAGSIYTLAADSSVSTETEETESSSTDSSAKNTASDSTGRDTSSASNGTSMQENSRTMSAAAGKSENSAEAAASTASSSVSSGSVSAMTEPEGHTETDSTATDSTGNTATDAGATTTQDEPAASGWSTKDDHKIYILDDGTMAKGLQTVDGETYFFDDNGYLIINQWAVTGKYFSGEDGRILTDTWAQIDGKYFYFGTDGTAYTGGHYISSAWYNFKADGSLITGQFVKWKGKIYFYATADDKSGKSSQIMSYNTSNKSAKTITFFSSAGARLNNAWAQINSKYYYFGNDDAAYTGGHYMNSAWYNFKADGSLITGQFVKWKGKIYFYATADDKSGKSSQIMSYNTSNKSAKTITFFSSAGARLRNAWAQIDSKYYYFGNDDAAYTGGHYMNSAWYNFKADGSLITGQFVKWKGKIYFYAATSDKSGTSSQIMSYNTSKNSAQMITFYTSYGARAANCNITINDKQYYFGSDGNLISTVSSSVRVIDVSYYQGSINWSKVRNSGVEAVIIRAGYGSWSGKTFKTVTDSKFQSYIKGAEAAGLKIGVYWFSEATTNSQAVTEAKRVLQLVKGHRISLPIYFDWEYYSDTVAKKHGVTVTKSNGKLDSMTLAFCSTIRGGGYRAGWYANKDYYQNKYHPSKLSAYSFWYAQYGVSKPSVSGMDLWQYGQKKVNGISAAVDVNKIYNSSLIR